MSYEESGTALLDTLVSVEFIVISAIGVLSKSDRVHAVLVVFHALFYLATEVQQVQVGF